MTQWQYRIHEFNLALGENITNEVEQLLDAMGHLGWELVAIAQPSQYRTFAFFKRPKT